MIPGSDSHRDFPWQTGETLPCSQTQYYLVRLRGPAANRLSRRVTVTSPGRPVGESGPLTVTSPNGRRPRNLNKAHGTVRASD